MVFSCLIMSGVRGDTRRYRALHLLEQCQLAGIKTSFVHLTDPDVIAKINQPWNIAILHRVPYRDIVTTIVENLLTQRTIILSDFDDLMFDPGVFQFINSPDFVDPVRTKLYLENMQNIRMMLERSDAAIASTEYLKDQIGKVGKKAWIHRNAFSLEMLSWAEKAYQEKRKSRHERVVIGYASGTPTHNRDFEMVKPVLIEIMRKVPQVELRLIGPVDAGGGWGNLNKRIRRLKQVPWRALPNLLAGLDINLAPLVIDNPFSQSKSEIKYMEAAMVRVPTIASPSDAFGYAIRDEENGLLAGNLDEWGNGLARLVKDDDLRFRLGNRAYADVIRDYHPVVRARQLIQLFDEVSLGLRGEVIRSGIEPSAEKINEFIKLKTSKSGGSTAKYEKDPSYLEIGLYELRNRNYISFILNVWIYFRRLISPIIPFRRARQ